MIIHIHSNIFFATVQSALPCLCDEKSLFVIFINNVIKKCLFIQPKCHSREQAMGEICALEIHCLCLGHGWTHTHEDHLAIASLPWACKLGPMDKITVVPQEACMH